MEGFGFGLEAGVEARKYFLDYRSKLFFGGYGGYGFLWQEGQDELRALSLGVKLGWREDLHRYELPLDLEPYLCLGFMVDSRNPLTTIPLRPVIYLGMKAGIF